MGGAWDLDDFDFGVVQQYPMTIQYDSALLVDEARRQYEYDGMCVTPAEEAQVTKHDEAGLRVRSRLYCYDMLDGLEMDASEFTHMDHAKLLEFGKRIGHMASENEIKYYSSKEILEIVPANYTVSVGGLRVNIHDLARSQWTARTVRNRYGGRSRLQFLSHDRKSVVLIRVSLPRLHASDLLSIIERIKLPFACAEATLTSNPVPINFDMTETQIMAYVERQIRSRVPVKPKTAVQARRVMDTINRLVEDADTYNGVETPELVGVEQFIEQFDEVD